MKIALMADIHLGQKKFDRDDEKLSLIDKLAKKYNKMIVLGDLFHSKITSSKIRQKFIQVVLNNPTTIFYIIGGNHDMTEDGFHPLSSESLIPCNLKMSDSIDSNSPILESVWFLHGYKLHERLPLLIQKIKDTGLKKNYLFSHFLLSGSKVKSGYQLSGELKVDDLIHFNTVVLGDIHQYQRVYNRVVYIGPLMRNDFGDGSSGYLEYDIKTNDFNYISINDRVKIIKITESSPNNLIVDENLKDHFIRFDLEGTIGWYNKMKSKISILSKENEVYINFIPLSDVGDIKFSSNENYIDFFLTEIKKKKLTTELQELVDLL